MAERNPFDQQPKGAREAGDAGRKLSCEEWEGLLADAMDGLLPATESSVFTAHSTECAMCAALLAASKQGQEWMQFLHEEPEMPADLVERILTRTSRAVADRPLAVYGAPIPVGGAHVLGIPMRRMVWDTRLMMTAAMAFFSIALTLNLAGVRITDLRLASLTPASLESNLTRQFYGAKSQVVRYYDNLRFVYEVESKMRELRQNEESAPAVQPGETQPKQEETPAPVRNPPASHKTGGRLETVPVAPRPDIVWGNRELARAELTCGSHFHRPLLCGPHFGGEALPGAPERNHAPGGEERTHAGKRVEVKSLVVLLVDQAEGSLA
jgi:anti-sigma factor RsiW